MEAITTKTALQYIIQSLNLAMENDCHSIAFPFISPGMYGYHKDSRGNSHHIPVQLPKEKFKLQYSNHTVLNDSSKNRREYFLNNIIGFHMKCPYCNEKVNEGDIICSN